MTAPNTGPTNAQISAMSETELEDLAHQRGLTVTGAGGGTPTRDDYLRALLAPDLATEQRNIADARNARLDETIPGGRYVSAQGKFVNAHGQEIDKDGKVVDGSAPRTNAEPLQ